MIFRGVQFAILLFAVALAPFSIASSAVQQKPNGPVIIPFELASRHILIRVSINNSPPLWFIFDTGDKVAIVDIARARSLGLNLQGEINIGGGGEGSMKGSYVRGATLDVIGISGHTQPVALAIPVSSMASRFGHDIDGIIGADFIKDFVVEIDYLSRVLKFHDKSSFTYTGSGEVVPITFVNGGHPTIPAELLVNGRDSLKGQFVVDFGSGGSLMLNRPFVEQHNLLAAAPKTIELLGAGGAGGKVSGRVGRMAGLRIGKTTVKDITTAFSADRGGVFASTQLQGNIGQQILSKFTVILDYSRERMIFEPNTTFKDKMGKAGSGFVLVAEGADYKTFRVTDLLPDSPATEAGIQTGDVLLSVDGRSASELTLTIIHEVFESPSPHKLSIRRGDKVVEITLTPRALV